MSLNVNDSRLVLRLSLPSPLKPGVKSGLQLHLSDQQVYCLLRCDLYDRFDGKFIFADIEQRMQVYRIRITMYILSVSLILRHQRTPQDTREKCKILMIVSSYNVTLTRSVRNNCIDQSR